MEFHVKELYDYHTGKWVTLNTDTPITKRLGEGFTYCSKCHMYSWDKYLYNYENRIYCDDCLIALLRVSE